MSSCNRRNFKTAHQISPTALTPRSSSSSLILALGSNIAPRATFLSRAIALLEEHVFETAVVSSHVYETAALLPEHPEENWDTPFLNLVLKAQCCLPPFELLAMLKKFEQELGRTASKRWSPRVIDIDILLYGDLCLNTPSLQIPHKELHKRPFVVIPLSELAPDAKVADKTIATWADSMRNDLSLLSRGTLASFSENEAA